MLKQRNGWRRPSLARPGVLALLKCSPTAGKTYEFGGPQVYSFKVLLELLLTALNRQRVLIPIPFALAEMQAALFERLPDHSLLRDQVRLLKTDKWLAERNRRSAIWVCSRDLLTSSLRYSRTSTADPMPHTCARQARVFRKCYLCRYLSRTITPRSADRRV